MEQGKGDGMSLAYVSYDCNICLLKDSPLPGFDEDGNCGGNPTWQEPVTASRMEGGLPPKASKGWRHSSLQVQNRILPTVM